jgi:hypothetical protein
MNDDVFLTSLLALDELWRHAGRREHALAGDGDAAVVTVVVFAAASFFNHYARAFQVM